MFALFIEKFENDERKLELTASKLILNIQDDDEVENGKCIVSIFLKCCLFRSALDSNFGQQVLNFALISQFALYLVYRHFSTNFIFLGLT